MIVDAYKSFNRVFSPSRADIESYIKILDRNGDGKVTIQDLEDLCTKYLTAKIWLITSHYQRNEIQEAFRWKNYDDQIRSLTKMQNK